MEAFSIRIIQQSRKTIDNFSYRTPWITGSQLKIVQIPHLYRPHLGGIENYVYRLKKSLESRGHEVEIYTSDLSMKKQGEKEEDTTYCDTFLAPLRNPISFELIDRVKDSKADIYHLHSPWFMTSLFSTLVLKNKPKVMTVHSAKLEGHDLKTFLLSKGYRPFASYVLGEMDKLMTQSTNQKADLIKDFSIPEEKIKVVPNGIIVEDFSLEKASRDKFIERYGLKGESFKILYISRMVNEKNQKSLVKAVSNHLKERNVEIILIGGGDPEYLKELRKIADERVHLLGKVDFDDIVSAYHTSDLFVFLGTWEGLPTVIMEAMVCGLPIITTPAGGIPNLIEEGVNGTYVPLPVPERKLADKIKGFLEDDGSMLEKIGQRNSKEIKDNYNWECIVERIIESYEEVL